MSLEANMQILGGSMFRQQAPERCVDEKSHSYFVAEVIAVESEGKVFVLRVCTHCAAAVKNEFVVAQPHSRLRLLREEGRETSG